MPDVGRLVLWAGTTRSPLAPVLGAIGYVAHMEDRLSRGRG